MYGYIVIIIMVIFFCYQVYSYYLEYKNDKNEIIQQVKKDLNVIYVAYYKRKGMSPAIPLEDLIIYQGDQSYTYNKKKIYLCLNDGDYSYDYDSIMYVAIHELAHVICDENGHTEKFWRINDELLEIAEDTKVYYGSKVNRQYCPLY